MLGFSRRGREREVCGRRRNQMDGRAVMSRRAVSDGRQRRRERRCKSNECSVANAAAFVFLTAAAAVAAPFPVVAGSSFSDTFASKEPPPSPSWRLRGQSQASSLSATSLLREQRGGGARRSLNIFVHFPDSPSTNKSNRDGLPFVLLFVLLALCFALPFACAIKRCNDRKKREEAIREMAETEGSVIGGDGVYDRESNNDRESLGGRLGRIDGSGRGAASSDLATPASAWGVNPSASVWDVTHSTSLYAPGPENNILPLRGSDGRRSFTELSEELAEESERGVRRMVLAEMLAGTTMTVMESDLIRPGSRSESSSASSVRLSLSSTEKSEVAWVASSANKEPPATPAGGDNTCGTCDDVSNDDNDNPHTSYADGDDADGLVLRIPLDRQTASQQGGGGGCEAARNGDTGKSHRRQFRTVPNACAICLSPYEPGSSVTWSPSCSSSSQLSSSGFCPHAFHSGCILTWLGKSDRAEQQLCPCCRQDF